MARGIVDRGSELMFESDCQRSSLEVLSCYRVVKRELFLKRLAWEKADCFESAKVLAAGKTVQILDSKGGEGEGSIMIININI
jgi:hypothetical protein